MTQSKPQKSILLGIAGGIACYKSCEIVRLLDKEGIHVRVVMTKSAREFVTPLTFQALSKNPVHTEIFDLTQESQMGHIELADSVDLILVAPATADLIGKVAHGLCDDLLTTLLCVTRAPIYMAPAMNVQMYENPRVQRNIKTLQNDGIQFIGPDSGQLACGYEGAGRLTQPDVIVQTLLSHLHIK